MSLELPLIVLVILVAWWNDYRLHKRVDRLEAKLKGGE